MALDVIEVKIENLAKRIDEQKEYSESNFKTIYERLENMGKETRQAVEEIRGLILKFFFGILGTIALSAVVFILTALFK